jgi:3-isopropylmalate dehydratase small subunit
MCRCGTLVLGLKYFAPPRALRNLKFTCLIAKSINGLFLRNGMHFGFPACGAGIKAE